MPLIPFRRYELRICTVRAVEKLLDSGEYNSEKDALFHIVRKKPELTGFTHDTKKVYQQFRVFKHRIKRK